VGVQEEKGGVQEAIAYQRLCKYENMGGNFQKFSTSRMGQGNLANVCEYENIGGKYENSWTRRAEWAQVWRILIVMLYSKS